MRENRPSGSEGGGPNPIVSPYPYLGFFTQCRQWVILGIFRIVSTSMAMLAQAC